MSIIARSNGRVAFALFAMAVFCASRASRFQSTSALANASASTGPESGWPALKRLAILHEYLAYRTMWEEHERLTDACAYAEVWLQHHSQAGERVRNKVPPAPRSDKDAEMLSARQEHVRLLKRLVRVQEGLAAWDALFLRDYNWVAEGRGSWTRLYRRFAERAKNAQSPNDLKRLYVEQLPLAIARLESEIGPANPDWRECFDWRETFSAAASRLGLKQTSALNFEKLTQLSVLRVRRMRTDAKVALEQPPIVTVLRARYPAIMAVTMEAAKRKRRAK